MYHSPVQHRDHSGPVPGGAAVVASAHPTVPPSLYTAPHTAAGNTSGGVSTTTASTTTASTAACSGTTTATTTVGVPVTSFAQQPQPQRRRGPRALQYAAGCIFLLAVWFIISSQRMLSRHEPAEWRRTMRQRLFGPLTDESRTERTVPTSTPRENEPSGDVSSIVVSHHTPTLASVTDATSSTEPSVATHHDHSGQTHRRPVSVSWRLESPVMGAELSDAEADGNRAAATGPPQGSLLARCLTPSTFPGGVCVDTHGTRCGCHLLQPGSQCCPTPGADAPNSDVRIHIQASSSMATRHNNGGAPPTGLAPGIGLIVTAASAHLDDGGSIVDVVFVPASGKGSSAETRELHPVRGVDLAVAGPGGIFDRLPGHAVSVHLPFAPQFACNASLPGNFARVPTSDDLFVLDEFVDADAAEDPVTPQEWTGQSGRRRALVDRVFFARSAGTQDAPAIVHAVNGQGSAEERPYELHRVYRPLLEESGVGCILESRFDNAAQFDREPAFIFNAHESPTARSARREQLHAAHLHCCNAPALCVSCCMTSRGDAAADFARVRAAGYRRRIRRASGDTTSTTAANEKSTDAADANDGRMLTAPAGSGGVQSDLLEQHRRFIAIARGFVRSLQRRSKKYLNRPDERAPRAEVVSGVDGSSALKSEGEAASKSEDTANVAEWVVASFAASPTMDDADAFALDFFGAALQSGESLAAFTAEATTTNPSRRGQALPHRPSPSARADAESHHNAEFVARAARHLYCQERCRPTADHTWMENRFQTPFHYCFGI